MMSAKTTTMAKTSKRGWQHSAAAVALALLAAACAGGSGSSGFLSEAAVIQSVLDEGRCMDLDGIEICPAGAAVAMPTQAPPSITPTPTLAVPPTPTDTPPLSAETPTPAETAAPTDSRTPAPSATPPPSTTPLPSATAIDSPPATPTPTATTVPGTGIDVALAPELSNDCGPAQTASPCLIVQLLPRGFPPGAAFYLATRAVDSEGVWQIVPTMLDGDVPAAGAFDGVIPLPSEGQAGNDGSAAQLQIVVLAFFTDPGFLPDTVERLSDTGADLAFALEPVSF